MMTINCGSTPSQERRCLPAPRSRSTKVLSRVWATRRAVVCSRPLTPAKRFRALCTLRAPCVPVRVRGCVCARAGAWCACKLWFIASRDVTGGPCAHAPGYHLGRSLQGGQVERQHVPSIQNHLSRLGARLPTGSCPPLPLAPSLAALLCFPTQLPSCRPTFSAGSACPACALSDVEVYRLQRAGSTRKSSCGTSRVDRRRRLCSSEQTLAASRRSASSHPADSLLQAQTAQ